MLPPVSLATAVHLAWSSAGTQISTRWVGFRFVIAVTVRLRSETVKHNVLGRASLLAPLHRRDVAPAVTL